MGASASLLQEREARSGACCTSKEIAKECLALEAKLVQRLGLACRAVHSHAVERYTRMGMYLMRYRLAISVSGRSWAGPERPVEAELFNSEYWRAD